MSRTLSSKSFTRAGFITACALCSLAWFASAGIPMTGSAANEPKVYGAIAEKWKQLRGAAGPLGAAKTDEHDKRVLAGGREIGVKWNQLGREGGYGYPLTDELPAFGGGRYNDFENGRSIYWHRRTGAHAVYGDIRAKWLSIGGVRKCGYPKTDEYADGSYRRTDCEKGYIRWSKQTGAKLYGCVTIDEGTRLNPVPN